MRLFRGRRDPHDHARALDIDYEPPLPEGEKRRTKPLLILFILVSVFLAAVAQLTLKYGVDRVTKHGGGSGIVLSEPVRSILRVAREPYVWLGLLLFAVSAAVWIVVLSRVSLSFAYPFAALTYVIILTFDRLFLKVDVPALRWAGVFLIVSGIILISRTPHT
jgi:multidrug transporter EmrE-like cation transporter